MFRWLALVFALGCGIPTATAPASDPSSTPYSLLARQWHARPLIVFAPAADDPRLQAQLAALDASTAGLTEREMDDVRITAGQGRANGAVMRASDVADLRERFGVQTAEFAVVLVGKDGGEKLRAGQPVPLQKLFDIIDAMPMRRREMSLD